MTTISFQDIERDPGGFLRRLEAGEEFLVVNNQRPVAEITPVAAPPSQPRPYGLCAGEFIVPAGFDQPLPDDVIAEFEGR